MKKVFLLAVSLTLLVSGCVIVEDENAHKVDNILSAVRLRSEVAFPEPVNMEMEWKTDEGVLKISGKGYSYVDPDPDQNQMMSSVLIFFRNYGFQRDVFNSQKNTEPFAWAYTQEGVGCVATHIPLSDTDLATDYRLDIRCGLLEKGTLTPWEEIRFNELMGALESGPAKEFSDPKQSVFEWVTKSGDTSDTSPVTGREMKLKTTDFNFVPFDEFFTAQGFASDTANSSRTETNEIRAYVKDTLACVIIGEGEESGEGDIVTSVIVRCGVLH